MVQARRFVVVAAALTVVAGVAVGVGITFGGDDGGGDGDEPALAQPDNLDFDPVRPRAGTFDALEDVTPPPAPPAGSPEEAATRFLTAEVAGDHEASFADLSALDREQYVLPEAWLEAHEDLWTLTGFRLGGAALIDGTDASLDVPVELRAGLDEILGLVPARAVLHLPLVLEDGGWRVTFSESTYEPEYLDDGAADDAVRQWAETRQRCQDATEYDGGLVGATYLAEQLCGADGSVTVGEVETVDRLPDATPYLNAFGPDVAAWGRVVPLSGAVEADAVVAPVGDRWLVVGVTPGGGGAGS